jgi:mRNA interferase YafQ
MRTIKQATHFKKNFRQVKANPEHARDIDGLLAAILKRLAEDCPLPEGNRDHSLTGNWGGYRECHVKPNLLLVYRKPDDNTLHLVRLASHSEIFG